MPTCRTGPSSSGRRSAPRQSCWPRNGRARAMPQLAERQRGFASALLDPELPVPTGLVGPDGEPDPKRFAVYRNNVVVSLIEALEDAFPAVRRIVGADFFRAMARAHVMEEPPCSPILLDY